MSRALRAGATIALAAVAFPAGAADPAKCATIADATSRLACYDAVFAPPASTGAPAAPAPIAPAATPAATANFGKPPPPVEAASIDAHIVGAFKGWERGTPFSLDNGQVWKVESDSAYYPDTPDNAHVTIERGFLGAYWMKVDAISRKIKVRRVS